jgi:hypothetical protein
MDFLADEADVTSPSVPSEREESTPVRPQPVTAPAPALQSAAAPAVSAPSRTPTAPRRERRSGPLLPEFRIERKHVMAVVGLMVAVGGWSLGRWLFRYDPPPVDLPDMFPFVECQVQMGGESVEFASIRLYDSQHEARKIVGFYDDERDRYRFVTSDGGTKKGGVPEGTYTVLIKPSRQTRVKIPSKYSDPQTSDLVASIQPGENILAPLQLTP